MNRFVHMVVLVAFLAGGFGVPMVFANEPEPPTEQKEKMDTTSGKADDGQKKDEKKDMGGK